MQNVSNILGAISAEKSQLGMCILPSGNPHPAHRELFRVLEHGIKVIVDRLEVLDADRISLCISSGASIISMHNCGGSRHAAAQSMPGCRSV